MKRYSEELGRQLELLLEIPCHELVPLFEAPKEKARGDLAFPCFKVAGRLKEHPADLARRLAEALPALPFLKGREAAGSYLNFRFNFAYLAERTVAPLLEGVYPPARETSTGKTVVIDFSSPNVGKPLAFHHLRSTMIGASLLNLYRAAGWRAIGINHLGDWGTTFGQYLVAIRRLAQGTVPDHIHDLMSLYVRFHEEARQDTSWEEEARTTFSALEAGGQEERKIWEQIRAMTWREYQAAYELLQVKFDHVRGESEYLAEEKSICEDLARRGLLKESEGAQVVDLSRFDMPPCLIRKKDGSTLYASRDLAAAVWRYRTWRFDRMLYVVDQGQALHFRQLFKVLELAGHDWVRECRHIPFGVVLFEGQKTGTRKGNVVFLKEVLEKSIKQVAEIIKEKHPELQNREAVSRDVGVGAIIFNDLKNRRIKEVHFDWKQALSFEGESGPYLQYTWARLASVVRKSGLAPSGRVPWRLLDSPEEEEIVRKLAWYPSCREAALKEHEPCHVANHLLELAAAFNNFYQHHRVLGVEEALSRTRLALVEAVRRVLAEGLELLCLAHPEEM